MAQKNKQSAAAEKLDPLAAMTQGNKDDKKAGTPAPPPLPSSSSSSKETKGTAQADADAAKVKKVPPPVLKPSGKKKAPPITPPLPEKAEREPAADDNGHANAAADDAQPTRRSARRRPAGPVRGRVAANDDVPSIGGLIYALEQKPSSAPFKYAAIASGIWAVASAIFTWLILSARVSEGASIGQLFFEPQTFLILTAVLVPIAVIWFLALLAWRAEELRLRSSTMTEVAVRLAEPDRMAEQSVATLGQSVRRQVGFMNDAVSQALGRAGELEAMVHKEVSNLEHSYQENEHKIRNLIQELSGERHALVNTSERVTNTLKELGNDVPALIEKLSGQQVKLAQIIQGAGENLTALETSLASSAGKLETALGTRTEALQTVLTDHTSSLETTLGDRTDAMQGMLEQYTGALGGALENRTEKMQGMLENYTSALAEALGDRTDQIQKAFETSLTAIDGSMSQRTDNLQVVFEEYGRALDTALANRADSLDSQLVERTKALDDAFSTRLQLFDDSIKRSTTAIDTAVSERANSLTNALENHANSFKQTITLQANDLDESINHGISAVRRSSENITRQSLKAIEGLSSQSDLLKNVTENLLTQVNGVTNRFENQGQTIMKAANALETANYKIDATLQHRHAEIAHTLDRLSGKADEFGTVISGYSSTIEGSISEAEARARAIAEDLRQGAHTHQQAAIESLQQMRSETVAQGDRALDELRQRFATVSDEVATHIGALSSRLDETSDEVRRRAVTAAQDIANEQARLKEQLDQIPNAAMENTQAMRLALEDQLRALEQLSALTEREARARDVRVPGTPPGPTTVIDSTPATGPSHYQTQAPAQQPKALSSLSSNLAAQQQAQAQQGRAQTGDPRAHVQPAAAGNAPQAGHAAGHTNVRQQPQAQPASDANKAAQGGGKHWSLGDLLERASINEDGRVTGGAAAINVDAIANALDSATATVIWSRVRMGQRGFMVKGLYSIEGRAAFDDLTKRLASDEAMRQAVRQYITDFERILGKAEQEDQTGRLTERHIASETGRVYIFLAHAAGRIS